MVQSKEMAVRTDVPVPQSIEMAALLDITVSQDNGDNFRRDMFLSQPIEIDKGEI